ncbi:isoprenyl transferase [Sporolactobacillus shoreae]|uniref:Isoprenyl transferase n=1 Tax=Sporolactobacillus shoreae TaxID=1465501 RepID=A0A4Z0GTK2_9BACL|nr:isoprenyl transferase [Sporolactobacillus shoreae]TGB00311.1 isoprenyl transferase [Sporolactobacillus shoreae]
MLDKFSFFKNGKSEKKVQALNNADRIPEHVAIIMDGNGRWAQRRGLPRIAGHREALKTIKKITYAAQHMGVKVLTLYAFSTENWKRPKAEVDFLMKLPEQFLNFYLAELIANNVQVRVMGDMSPIPAHTISAVNTAIEKTRENTGLILNFALNYGSHAEIVGAVRSIVQDVLDQSLEPENINEKTFSDRMISPSLPNPDLLIRTGGEIRLSNFMLWQMAYTELYFTKVYWPDFSEEDLSAAIYEFSTRQRRYGGIKGEGNGDK